MTLSRDRMLHEMGLSPQWKLRDQPGVARAEKEEGGAAPAASAALAETVKSAQDASPAAVRSPVPADVARPAQIARMGWEELRQSVADCRACGLCEQRQQAVLGVGDVAADWLFIGEGPGSEEDARGEPFVGSAGKLLDAMLAAIDLKRGADVYIANAVKCRPPNNRTPEAGEMATCAPYLQRQIALLQPKLIVLLGRAAMQAVLRDEAGASSLAAMRGKTLEYRDGGRRIPVLVTYHPAYLLRTLPDKAKAWEDLCRARTLMRAAKSAGLEKSPDHPI